MYYTNSGSSISLGNQLGSGGEGAVYAVQGRPNEVAKVYHQLQATKDRHQKLDRMVANPPKDPCAHLIPPHVSIAWPTELLFADSSCTSFVGYLMPLVSGAKKIASAYHAPTRRRQMLGFSWKYLICTARNLASSVQALHDKGYVIGDLNESNALVFPSALITIIDTDSFQVHSGNTCFRCCVGKPEFTAPQSQMKDFSTFDRTANDDCFALAVMVFLLLMEGRHPFDGIAQRVPDLVDTGDRIRSNWFKEAHALKSGVIDPPTTCPPFSMLPSTVSDLFRRCFVDGEGDPTKRPTALEWMNALDIAMSSLATCSSNSLHQYSSHLASCPWCQRMSQLQVADPFPSTPPKPAKAQTTVTAPGQHAPAQVILGPARRTGIRARRRATVSPPIAVPPAATIPGATAVPAAAASIPSPQPIAQGHAISAGQPVSGSVAVPPGQTLPQASSVPSGQPVASATCIPAGSSMPAGSPINRGQPIPSSTSISAGQTIPQAKAVPNGVSSIPAATGIVTAQGIPVGMSVPPGASPGQATPVSTVPYGVALPIP